MTADSRSINRGLPRHGPAPPRSSLSAARTHLLLAVHRRATARACICLPPEREEGVVATPGKQARIDGPATTGTGTDQILLGQLYRWRGSFEYEYESAVNTHGWCYVAGFAGAQIRPGSCKAAWSVPQGPQPPRPLSWNLERATALPPRQVGRYARRPWLRASCSSRPVC